MGRGGCSLSGGICSCIFKKQMNIRSGLYQIIVFVICKESEKETICILGRCVYSDQIFCLVDAGSGCQVLQVQRNVVLVE